VLLTSAKVLRLRRLKIKLGTHTRTHLHRTHPHARTLEDNKVAAWLHLSLWVLANFYYTKEKDSK